MKIPKLLLAIGVASVALTVSQAQTWTSVDVGNTADAGSVAAGAGGTLTITGSGDDIWNAADAFHYFYTTVTGDFDVNVRVDNLTGVNEWAKCELMVRGQSAPGSGPAADDPFYANMTTRIDGNGRAAIQPQFRASRGAGAASWEPTPDLVPQYPGTWLRVVRAGNMLTQYVAFGVDAPGAWELRGDGGYDMSGWEETGEVMVGIAVTSHDNGGSIAEATTSQVFPFELSPLMSVSADALGFVVQVSELSDPISAITTVTLDGVDKTTACTITDNGGGYTITYNVVADTGNVFVSGSAHTLDVAYDSASGGGSLNGDFVVSEFIVVPADLKIAGSLDPNLAGDMNFFVYQTEFPRAGDANATASYEQQLAGAVRNPSGDIQPNVANQPEPTSPNDYPLDVNYNVYGGDIDGDPNLDFFNATATPDYPNAKLAPFIDDGDASGGENFTAEFYGWIELDAGFHTMSVLSDDGFKLSIGKSTRDVFGVVVGQFSGGRGASRPGTEFGFQILESGIYPFRLIWGQGGGGGNCEWFMIEEDGNRVLINDVLQNPIFGGTWDNSLYTWAEGGSGRAAVTRFVPYPGYTGVDLSDAIEWTITSGTTSAMAGGTTLIVDGVEVITGGGATGSYAPVDGWTFGSEHSGQLIWTETGNIVHTENFNFIVRTEGLQDLGYGFFIEAEDYDYGSGQSLAIASDMSATGYTGGAYQSTATGGPYAAVEGIDMTDNTDGTTDGGAWVYRATSTNDLDSPNAHQPDATIENSPVNRDKKRGDGVYTFLNDWKLGWMGGNRWFNYTRNVPPGVYKAFGVFSHGDVDAQVGGDLGIVTAGVGTTDQTVVTVGSFSGAAVGGWGTGTWVPLRQSYANDAPPAIFKIGQPTTTFRLTSRNGDFHHIQLAQAATGEVFPPILRESPDYNYAIDRRGVELRWVIEDFTAMVDPDSILVEAGPVGTLMDVTADAVVTKDGDYTTITYTPTTMLEARTMYEYKLTFSDDSAEPLEQTSGGTLMTSYLPSDNGDLGTQGYFLIEAEDFNYDGGMTLPIASTMPYLGEAYAGLGSVLGIDYDRADIVDYTDDGQLYRPVDTNVTAGVQPVLAVNNTDPADTLRNVRDMSPDGTATWSVANNYKIGWSGTGRWFDYTRSIPDGEYEVWGGLAVDQTAAGTMRASVHTVTGATTTNQVATLLGVFDGGGTGTWGDVVLVPLLDSAATRNIQTLEVAGGGDTTLRWELDSGDIDYLMLVPTGAVVVKPVIGSIEVNGDGMLEVNWTGGGTLQGASSVPAGPWTDITSVSPAVIDPPASGEGYYRVVGD